MADVSLMRDDRQYRADEVSLQLNLQDTAECPLE
jgi:hypothetical protein